MEKAFYKRVVISNMLNVIGFITFFSSKFFNNESLFFISLFLFIASFINSFFLWIYFSKIKGKLNTPRKKLLNVTIRTLFALFFITYWFLIWQGVLEK